MTSRAFALAAALAAALPSHPLAQPRPGPAGHREVVVTNTRSNPVPVAPVGTTAVAGSVAVTNTPSVSIAGPVSVRDAADRDLHFVLLECAFDPAFSGGRMCTATAFVPPGKRYVIRSATFFLPFPGASAMGEITAFTGSGMPHNWLGPIGLVSPLNGYLWAYAEMTLHADAQRNQNYGVRAQCTTSADASPRTCTIQLWGYLIDCTEATCRHF